jgi:hypothetical protein
MSKTKKKWRAKKGESYFIRGSEGQVLHFIEHGLPPDDMEYKRGNYYRTWQEVPPGRVPYRSA